MTELRQISEFFPPGTQLKSPGGLSCAIEHITAIEATGEPHGYLKIFVLGGKEPITLTFHRNTNGGSAAIYEIKRNIEAARELQRERV